MPPTTAENEKRRRGVKENPAASIDSTELSASAASVSPSLVEFPDLDSRESTKMGFDFDAVEEEEEDSSYPESRASVSNVDDPEMPALTFRMWDIELVLCMVGSGFFNFRQPAPQVIRSFSYSSRTPSENSQRIRYR